MNEPTLHPNLAKLAAAYDEILDRMGRGQITAVAARTEISQLEARDDQGVRWNIDADTGEWVRKTALGDYEYDDAPPTYGYATPDAFDYTQNPQVFNPADRIQMAVVNEHLEHAPSSLAGATRSLHPDVHVQNRGLAAKLTGMLGPQAGAKAVSVLSAVGAASTRAKVVGAAVVFVLLALVLYSCSGGAVAPPTAPPDPAPSKTSDPGKGAGKQQPAKKQRTSPTS